MTGILQPDRVAIGAALMAKLVQARWGSPERGFRYTSERLQIWEDAPAQPALYVTEGDERHTVVSGRPPVRDLEYRVVVYQDTGKDPANARPATENDLIFGALERLLQDGDTPEMRQTLGGVCHHARIDGAVMKDSGDLDGQGMILFSVWVMVP